MTLRRKRRSNKIHIYIIASVIVLLVGASAMILIDRHSKNGGTNVSNANADDPNLIHIRATVNTRGWQSAEFEQRLVRFQYPAEHHTTGPLRVELPDQAAYDLIGANPALSDSEAPDPKRIDDSDPLFQIRIYNKTYAEFRSSALKDYGTNASEIGKSALIGGKTARVLTSALGEMYAVEYSGSTYVFRKGQQLEAAEADVFSTILATVSFLKRT